MFLCFFLALLLSFLFAPLFLDMENSAEIVEAFRNCASRFVHGESQSE